MEKSELLILSGLPASGKTKYAKEWLAEDPEHRRRVNYDDLRLELFGANWRWNRKDETVMKTVARVKAAECLETGFSVVIDNTSLSSAVRKSWRQFGESLGAEVIEQEFDTDVFTCVERDRERKGSARVGAAVIWRMALTYGFVDWDNLPSSLVICDIDGTVADCSHRLKFLTPTIHHAENCALATPPEEKVCLNCGKRASKNWAAFNKPENLLLDQPIVPICNLVRLLHDRGSFIIFLTGRGTDVGITTEEWFELHGMGSEDLNNSMLLMRQVGDHRSDVIVKREILDYLPKSRIRYVLEDRTRVVEEVYRSAGLTVLQPARGDF